MENVYHRKLLGGLQNGTGSKVNLLCYSVHFLSPMRIEFNSSLIACFQSHSSCYKCQLSFWFIPYEIPNSTTTYAYSQMLLSSLLNFQIPICLPLQKSVHLPVNHFLALYGKEQDITTPNKVAHPPHFLFI